MNYLNKPSEVATGYLFELPAKITDISDIANTALRLAALSSRLAMEERTLVNHKTGRAENVAEHSAMLAIVAPAIAEQYYPDLDANLVSRFAAIHDAVEAYVGDTTTHNIDQQGLKEKAAREALGLERLRQEFATLPNFVKLVGDYEAQQISEARFVRIVDKWAPVLLHFSDDGATLRSYTNPTELVQNFVSRAVDLKAQYPDFAELVEVRQELTRLASETLFSR